jgi:hypothetical protein
MASPVHKAVTDGRIAVRVSAGNGAVGSRSDDLRATDISVGVD